MRARGALPALRLLLAGLGMSALVICLAIMVAGAERTALVSERLYDALTGYRGPSSPPWPPTMDSELRFYAPFWGAYGGLLLLVASDLQRRGHWTPWLAGVFFAGGVGRAISLFAVGAPHPVFLGLMAIELGLPPVLAGLWLSARSRPDGP